jgi:hypothetical protein
MRLGAVIQISTISTVRAERNEVSCWRHLGITTNRSSGVFIFRREASIILLHRVYSMWLFFNSCTYSSQLLSNQELWRAVT